MQAGSWTLTSGSASATVVRNLGSGSLSVDHDGLGVPFHATRSTCSGPPPLLLPVVYLELKLTASFANLVVAEQKIERSHMKSRTKWRLANHRQ
jgi:hypothetical protein